MVEQYAKKLYPKDIEKVSKESKIWKHLNLGREVVVGPFGWILDVRDPSTSNLYDDDGNLIGTRGNTFPMPNRREHRVQSAEIVLPERAWEFHETGYMWRLLSKGYQVTRGPGRAVIDIWDPKTKTVRDKKGDEIGTRDTPYSEYKKKELKNPLRHTYEPTDYWKWGEGTDIRNALEAGREVTVDDRDVILDVWDRATGKQYNFLGNVIGTRTDPYPSDNNMGDVLHRVGIANAEIAALRAALRTERGAARAATNAELMALLRERGRLVFLHGRLMNRKRRMDVAYQKRMTKGKK